MTGGQGPTELFSDFAPFDPAATCIGCHRPVHHHAPGSARHPAFAGGITLPDGRFQQLAVVCNECIIEAVLIRCVWEARQRSGKPVTVRYIYQRIGTPEAAAELLRFIEGLHR